jgi:gamma-tubulin complex component 3
MTATESALVREVLHCCQGIDGGRFVSFENDTTVDTGRFACGLGVDVSPAQRQLISKITELGWLLRKVKELTAKAAAQESVVHEALVAACNKEVNNCYRLIAILEAQYQQQQQQQNTTTPSNIGPLSLRRLVVWLAEPQQRLRVLASCLDAAVGLRGGQVINALHAMSKHGDPLVRRAVGPLLEETCVPFFKKLSLWILNGALDGTASGTAGTGSDFMIIQQQLGSDHPAAVWRAGYALDSTMQPRFVSPELAQRVLTTGKTVAFLRECCGDSEWAAAMAHTGSIPGVTDSSNGGTTLQRLKWLETATADVGATVGSKLLDVLMRRESLPAHLAALRRYILLGQGDFVRTLLDLAGPELDRPAKEISIFSLQGHVETALRSCGAAVADADLLRRVQVKLNRALDGDCGWDVFGLVYSLDGPAVVVFSPDAMASYGRVSRLLWNIKQVDHVVARAWHDLDNMSHSLATLRGLEREYGIDAAAVAGDVPSLLRYLHAQRADMAHFVASLQAKILYEVIEPAWAKLEATLRAAVTLDEVITAHETALQAIIQGTYLDGLSGGSGSSSGKVRSSSANSGGLLNTADGGTNTTNTSGVLGGGNASDVHAALRAALRAVLNIAGPIRRVADALEFAVIEQQTFLKRAKESEASGEWNEDVYNSPQGVSRELLAEVRSGAWRVHSAFDRHVRTFHALVPQHSHLDLRWLSSRLEPLDAGITGGGRSRTTSAS